MSEWKICSNVGEIADTSKRSPQHKFRSTLLNSDSITAESGQGIRPDRFLLFFFKSKDALFIYFCFKSEHIGQHQQLVFYISVNHGKVRLPTGFYTAFHHTQSVGLRLYHHRGSAELLWLIKRAARQNQQPEGSVRFSAHAKNRCLLCRPASEFHRGADLPVRVNPYLRAGVRAGQRAGGSM